MSVVAGSETAISDFRDKDRLFPMLSLMWNIWSFLSY